MPVAFIYILILQITMLLFVKGEDLYRTIYQEPQDF